MYMLRNRKITLLNPANWDDSNDSYYLRLYKNNKNLGSVLALCFTEAVETYHHWRVYSSGNSGVCICFNKEQFLDQIGKKTSIRSNPVEYKTISRASTANPAIDDLPFLKRYGFLDEKEFRLVYDSKKAIKARDFSIGLNCIDRIIINPWLNKPLFIVLRDTLRSLPDCEKLNIRQSSLVNNREWKRLGGNAE
jgi:hypothetical protein